MNTIEDLAAIAFGSTVVMGFFTISFAFFVNSVLLCGAVLKEATRFLF
jgi:hypothetical protein